MAIQAATPLQITKSSGDWIFVDLGFAAKKRSCGVLLGSGDPEEVRFSDLCQLLISEVKRNDGPLNLLLETPLSVAFDQEGNPTGRSIEKRGSVTRYWYVGLGCSVLTAATYLLRSLNTVAQRRDVRLIEGLASFKPQGTVSSHKSDVLNLREAAWSRTPNLGRIVPASELTTDKSHKLESAFAVAGMDFGIPPVVALGG